MAKCLLCHKELGYEPFTRDKAMGDILLPVCDPCFEADLKRANEAMATAASEWIDEVIEALKDYSEDPEAREALKEIKTDTKKKIDDVKREIEGLASDK